MSQVDWRSQREAVASVGSAAGLATATAGPATIGTGVNNRSRLLRALPRPALLRVAALYSIARGPGFVPTSELVAALERREEVDQGPGPHIPEPRLGRVGRLPRNGEQKPRDYHFRSFVAARAFVRRLNLQNTNEWNAWCRGERPDLPARPDDVPTNPHRTYRKEWRGAGDWLGTGTVAKRKRVFLPFAEARRLVKAQGLSTLDDYAAWRRGLRPDLPPPPAGLPGHPAVVYRAHWRGPGHFLGTGRASTWDLAKAALPFAKARAFARTLGLRSWKEWQAWAHGTLAGKPPRPPGIPSNPHRTYAGRGWIDMADWLGTARRQGQPRRAM